MSATLYTATGCARCKITKRYIKEHGFDFEAFDFKAKGKDAFAKFYCANRSSIYRDRDEVAFPVFTDGSVIRQGVSVVVGYLLAGTKLEGFVGRNVLHGEWIDGFNISGGNPAHSTDLIALLRCLKGKPHPLPSCQAVTSFFGKLSPPIKRVEINTTGPDIPLYQISLQ